MLLTALDKPLLHPEKEWYCYLLTTRASTVPYIGKTCDLTRRLREHNGELVGGAKRTHRAIADGADVWTRQLHVRGFPDERAALNFEWRWEYDRRRNAGEDGRAGLTPLQRGLRALCMVLQRPQPTSLALPFVMYPSGGVTVVVETPEAEAEWAVWREGCPPVHNHVGPNVGLDVGPSAPAKS